MSLISSALLSALMRSMASVKSTKWPRPNMSFSTRTTNLCGMAPAPSQPTVR